MTAESFTATVALIGIVILVSSLLSGLVERSGAVLAEASLVGVLFSAGRAPFHGRILDVPGARRVLHHFPEPKPSASRLTAWS